MELSDLWQRVFLRILKNELWRHNNFFNAKGWQGKDKHCFLNFYKQGLQNWVNVPSPILLQQEKFSLHPQFKIVFRDPCSYAIQKMGGLGLKFIIFLFYYVNSDCLHPSFILKFFFGIILLKYLDKTLWKWFQEVSILGTS